jgi:nucleotide-binding universal stress UspA family protein
MFETVIVPLDGSPHAEFAIPYAIDEARRHQAKMVLVHVIPRPEPCTSPVRWSGPVPWQGEWPVEEIDPTKHRAETYLRDVVMRYGLDPGTRVCVAAGDPGVRVAAEAVCHGRPLVVMLTGDNTHRSSPSLSLVTTYLLITSAVPVLGISQPSPGRPATPRRVSSAGAQLRLSRPGPIMLPSVPPVASPAQR